MSFEEARDKYIEMFGGYPYFLLMGLDDEEAAAELIKCINSGKEMEAPDPDADY